MKSRIIKYTRNLKSPTRIQEELNGLLEQVHFKYIVQNESPSTGGVLLTILYEELEPNQKPNAEVKVIRAQSPTNTEDKLDHLLANLNEKVLIMTQSFSANTILTMIFHERKSEASVEKTNKKKNKK